MSDKDEIYRMLKMDLFINYRRLLLFTAMQEWLEGKPEVRNAWKDMIIKSPKIIG